MRCVVLVVFAVAAVGCSGEGSQEATSAPTGSTVESPRPTVAPPVGEPIDLRPHRRHSCALLSAEQLAELAFPPRAFEGASADSGRCEWRAHEDEPDRIRDLYSLTVHVTGDPLGAAYQDSDRRLGNGKWAWPLFEPRTVRDLPAVVRANLNPDRYCDVVVGVGQEQGITVTGSPGVAVPDLCDQLVAAAELVVDETRP